MKGIIRQYNGKKWIKIKNPCLEYSKGWFTKRYHYNHDWGYITKENRKCLKCGIREIYFGHPDLEGLEDWRKAYD